MEFYFSFDVSKNNHACYENNDFYDIGKKTIKFTIEELNLTEKELIKSSDK